jgi:serine/threonine protein kinase
VDNPGKGCFVLHLDLKPDNVFLDYGEDEDGASYAAHYPDIRIADFGLSEYTNNADSTNPDMWGPGVGTPGYQPPVSLVNLLSTLPTDQYRNKLS